MRHKAGYVAVLQDDITKEVFDLEENEGNMRRKNERSSTRDCGFDIIFSLFLLPFTLVMIVTERFFLNGLVLLKMGFGASYLSIVV